MSPVSGTGTFTSQSWNTLGSPYDKWEEQKHQTILFFWSLYLTEMSFAYYILYFQNMRVLVVINIRCVALLYLQADTLRKKLIFMNHKRRLFYHSYSRFMIIYIMNIFKSYS